MSIRNIYIYIYIFFFKIIKINEQEEILNVDDDEENFNEENFNEEISL